VQDRHLAAHEPYDVSGLGIARLLAYRAFDQHIAEMPSGNANYVQLRGQQGMD
jgi:hypothetical protein